jgi:uncharacterized membrane protein HdeD (DUF308 family)
MTDNLNTPHRRVQAAAAAVQHGASERLGDLWRAFLLRGVLAAMLGICALIWPTTSIAILARLVGLFFVIDGVTGLIATLRGSERGSTLLQAVIGLAIGLALLFWPGASARILLLAFGVWALVTGVSMIVRARRVGVLDELRSAMTWTGIILVVLGIVLLLWPGAGAGALAWVIGIGALLLTALLIFLAIRFKRARDRIAGL